MTRQSRRADQLRRRRHWQAHITAQKGSGLSRAEYLRYIFDKLPTASSLEDYEALLPWNIALGQVKRILTG